MFSPAELDYLHTQQLGRMATVQPNGTLQVSPVGFRYNAQLQTVDIRGFGLTRSRKYRNVAANGRVAFVVDDVPSIQPWRVRCLEIRGRAEAVPADPTVPVEPGGVDGALIRIHPEQIISVGIDETGRDVHEMAVHNRRVTLRAG